MKLFLTDDHAILLSGLIKVLSTEDFIEVVGTAGTAQETLEKLTRVDVDLLITDYNLPDRDGLDLVKVAKIKYPDLGIIVLSMHEESHLIREILQEGIDGYILKKDSHHELISGVKAVRDGKMYVSREVNDLILKDFQNGEPKLLTRREREILKLMAKKYTNRDIARELFISERTVETHRKNIFRKTGTHSVVGLMKFAYNNHLI